MNTARTFSSLAAGLVAALTVATIAGEPKPARTPVEHVTGKPRRLGEGLGTIKYSPSDQERPFFSKLDAEESLTGSILADYSLAGKEGKYVGWFGVVRETTEDAAGERTVLTVEHKYFDGLTDVHIQALSFNGGGDFRAVLHGVGHRIPSLSLVKIYGTVAGAKEAGIPLVEAVFVRNWHWGTFTFLADYGTQKGSQRWRKLNQVPLEQIYDPYPGYSYYEHRLGKRPPDDQLYRRLMKPAGNLSPEAEKLMIELIDSLQAETLHAAAWVVEKIRKRQQEPAAIAILLPALTSDEDLHWWAVSYALGRLAGPEDVPPVVACLGHESPDVRARAAETLSSMGKTAAPAVPALIEALRDTDTAVRLHAADALRMIGPQARAAVGPLKTALTDPDGVVRVWAAEALWEITFEAEPAVSVLIAALKSGDEDLQIAAAEALDRIGPGAASAGPALVDALEEPELRYSAVSALGAIRPPLEAVIPALVETLKDGDRFVRAQAANALGEYRSAAQTAVPALMTGLEDEDDYVRWESAEALGEIGPGAERAIPALIDVVRHDDDDTARDYAAQALGSIDVEGRTAIPALTEALRDPSDRVRFSAALALGEIGANARAALPALQAATEDEDMLVRVAAAESLWRVARDGDRAMPVLIEVLKATDRSVYRAAMAVKTIGPEAQDAVPLLIGLLDREDEHLRYLAVEALGSVGPGAVEAVPLLVDMLESKERYLPVAAAGALWHINRHARAIPALIELLGTEDSRTRAAEALGRIGPAAREAVPALRELAGHPDPRVRDAATEALRKVSGESTPDGSL